jgi:membrane-associated protease RseP (regulator of RpoE activity)
MKHSVTRLVIIAAAVVVGLLQIISVAQLRDHPYDGYFAGRDHVVVEVAPGGPAQRAGLRPGDRILRLGGVAADDSRALDAQPRARIGDTREIIVERGGLPVTLAITLTSMPPIRVVAYLASNLTGIVLGLAPVVATAITLVAPRVALPGADYYDVVYQYPERSMSFVVRTAAGDPLRLVTPLRTEMATIDASQPLSDVRTMEEVVRIRLAQPTLLMLLTSAFAGLAALLALVGVYGLMACTISQQRGELGIRLALGATPGALLRMVLSRGAVLAGVGIGLGVLGAIGLTRFMTSMLYQVTPTDPVVIVAACGAILAAALAACWVPARTAARVDPIEALRVS